MIDQFITYIPHNLDIDTLLEEYPPTEIKYFHKDILIYVLGLITEIPARSDRDNFKNGYVPLNSYILKKIIWNYKHYLDYLVRTGVLISDNQYIPGRKSKGYKYAELYNDIVIPKEVGKPSLTKKFDRSIKIGAKLHQEKPYLGKWFNNKLCIDLKGATQDLKRLYESVGTGKKSSHWYNHSLANINQLADHNYSVDVDSTAGRLHSPLTRMNREFRKHITYDGQKLVAIDIGSSQPYLSTKLLTPEFFHPPAAPKYPNQKAPLSISYSLYCSPPLPPSLSSLMVQKIVKSTNNEDVTQYIDLVVNDKIYAFIQKELQTRSGATISRDEAKSVLFIIFYSTNYFIGQPGAFLKRAFRDKFPSVYEIFALVKRGDHRRLAILLQRIESYIVLSLVCKKISIEKPDLPIFTIHDSVVTIQGYENYIKSIMEEVLVSCVGHKPTLKIEYWG